MKHSLRFLLSERIFLFSSVFEGRFCWRQNSAPPPPLPRSERRSLPSRVAAVAPVLAARHGAVFRSGCFQGLCVCARVSLIFCSLNMTRLRVFSRCSPAWSSELPASVARGIVGSFPGVIDQWLLPLLSLSLLLPAFSSRPHTFRTCLAAFGCSVFILTSLRIPASDVPMDVSSSLPVLPPACAACW